jgi:hypothetical protein
VEDDCASPMTAWEDLQEHLHPSSEVLDDVSETVRGE